MGAVRDRSQKARSAPLKPAVLKLADHKLPAFMLISKPLHKLKQDTKKPGKNSKFDGIRVPFEEVRVWDNFLGNGEIETMLHDEYIAAVLNRVLDTIDDVAILNIYGERLEGKQV